ncbi:hypothetical protein [Paenibacillus spongiae]|uniref:Uncharacterized protein n=1 Tax=Paenibacillus spongiae TaxID=2909671 RepID=A0ABY5SI08_9BACL|nr:hypothetical protein [Paenibacillus spongiae]UVI33218.1 hypothetical protein L1F29_15835 [Paenibacillus spongiae]
MNRKKWLAVLLVIALAFPLLQAPTANAAYEDIIVPTGDPWTPVQLENGGTLGQSFTAPRAFNVVLVSTPTWNKNDSGFTFTLRSDGPDGTVLYTQVIAKAVDGQTAVELPEELEPGTYYAEMSDPVGQIGWWTKPDLYAGGTAFSGGAAVPNQDRSIVLRSTTGSGGGGEQPPVDFIYEDVLVPHAGSMNPVMLVEGETLGQDFLAVRSFNQLTLAAPTWTTSDSGFTFTLYKDGPTGKPVFTTDVRNARDNRTDLFLPEQPPGRYYAEMSNPVGTIGWWTKVDEDTYAGGIAYQDGSALTGADRAIVSRLVEEETTAEEPPFVPHVCPAPEAGAAAAPNAPQNGEAQHTTPMEAASYDVLADLAADDTADYIASRSGDGTESVAGPSVKLPRHYEAIHLLANHGTSAFDLTDDPVYSDRTIIPAGQTGSAELVGAESSLGQEFVAASPFTGIKLEASLDGAGAALTVRQGGPTGAVIYCGTVDAQSTDGTIMLPPQSEGRYYVELSMPQGSAGWMTYNDVYAQGTAYSNGTIVPGADRGISSVHEVGNTLGQTFEAIEPFNQLLVPLQNLSTDDVQVQLYYRGTEDRNDNILMINAKLERLSRKWAYVRVGDQPAGRFYVEFSSKGSGTARFPIASDTYAGGEAFRYGEPWTGHDMVLAYARSSEPAAEWDTNSGSWIAVDELGRQTSGSPTSSDQEKEKFVGIFYHTWHGQHGSGGPYDISKILAQDPSAITNPDSPLWGPMHTPHHWGESVFGYYLSDDEYVIRKHAQMLTDIGVDAVIFDESNNFSYKSIYMKLLRVYREIRLEGGKTPQVIFLTPFGNSSKVVEELYENLYGAGLFADLWFRWDGKPIIMANPDSIDAKYKEFFTVRRPQPSYFAGPQTANSWGWLEVAPQHGFYDEDGNIEEMTVGVAQNSVNGRLSTFTEAGATGRSFHNGQSPSEPFPTEQGLNFQEQWDRAFELDPEFVFVTGWNEWTAGRFAEFNGVRLPVMFVDQFNQEFSRDIEPMVGGHTDNYYYQLAANIARFKGTNAPQPAAKAIGARIDGKFSEWNAVRTSYKDDYGDTMHRSNRGYGNLFYVNETGRNDLVEQRVTHDKDNAYFYVKTKDTLTSHTDPHWMQLFLNTDSDYTTGWNGYDYVVGDRSVNATTTSLHRMNADGTLTFVANVSFRYKSNELELAIPLTKLGYPSKARTFQFDFKWTDNIQKYDIAEFTVNGDSAPNNRFNYRYTAKK